ncbi:hypothetical protein pipiens_015893, partial [Culex pipiens pipiens]
EPGRSSPAGKILVKEAPEMLAIAHWTGQIPRRPPLPDGVSVSQLIALGSRRKRSKVYWMIAKSEEEVSTVSTVGKMFRLLGVLLVNAFHWFCSHEHCFVVVLNFNRVIGFTGYTWDHPIPVVKAGLLIYAVLYEIIAIVAIAFFEPGPVSIDQRFGMIFVMNTGLMCVIIWVLLAMQRRELDLVLNRLMELQRQAVDDRRRQYIWRINCFSLCILVQNLVQIIIWNNAVDYSCPLQVFESELVDQLNVVCYPLAMTLLSLMFVYTIILISAILPALSVEFILLGEDFQRIFDNVGPLFETARNANSNWTKLENNMKSCIRRHQELLTLAELFQRRLKLFFLFNLTVDFFLITFSCFQFGINRRSDSLRYMYSAFAAITATINLLMFGKMCDQLETYVSSIKLHLYSSNWVDRLVYSRTFAHRYKNFRKLMLIVMERTERKVGFTCGNFYAMSLTTCCSVLQFCYSVFTLLLSVFE